MTITDNFIHVPTDCYNIIKSYFQVVGSYCMFHGSQIENIFVNVRIFKNIE